MGTDGDRRGQNRDRRRQTETDGDRRRQTGTWRLSVKRHSEPDSGPAVIGACPCWGRISSHFLVSFICLPPLHPPPPSRPSSSSPSPPSPPPSLAVYLLAQPGQRPAGPRRLLLWLHSSLRRISSRGASPSSCFHLSQP